MKTILRKDIPEDFTYYRTGSRVFFEYLEKFRSYRVDWVKKNQFFTAVQVLPGFWNVTAEKLDFEVTREMLVKHGIRHGIVYWTPMRVMEKPKGWWRVPTWWMKRDIHSSRSAFSVLDREDYWSKWSPKARAHRRKVLDLIASGKIVIRKDISHERFLELYRNTKVSDGHKSMRLRLAKKIFTDTKTDYRIYVIEVDGRPLAGGLFIDMGTTSEYYVSWYHHESYPYHLGIAMMDRWFLDSYAKGVKYCDLDHMRDSWQSLGYAGYTKFKESIADHDVYFHDMWVKIF